MRFHIENLFPNYSKISKPVAPRKRKFWAKNQTIFKGLIPFTFATKLSRFGGCLSGVFSVFCSLFCVLYSLFSLCFWVFVERTTAIYAVVRRYCLGSTDTASGAQILPRAHRYRLRCTDTASGAQIPPQVHKYCLGCTDTASGAR